MYKFPSHEDLESFAEQFLQCDYDDFYVSYYGLCDEEDINELEQEVYEY